MATLAGLSLALIASLAGTLLEQPPETGLGRITGRTISPAFEPVANAQVLLACPPLRVQTVVSDASGHFEFQSPNGNCRVIARKDGYVETSFSGPPAPGGYGLAVRDGTSHDGIELQLVKGAVISGVITGPGGAPPDGIRFQLVRREVTNGIVKLVPLSYAPVRDGGRYRTAPVAPGDYYILASPPPAGSPVTVPNVAMTYFPGTANLSEATLIAVKAGDVREANFSVVPSPSFTVTGIVKDALGNPLADASIHIVSDGSAAWIRGTGRTGSDGRFSITGLTNGPYLLRAIRVKKAGQPQEVGEVHFDVNGGDVDLLVVRTAVR